MIEAPSKHSEQTILIRNCMVYVVSWTIICLFATFYNFMEIKNMSLELVQKEARMFLNKDQKFQTSTTDE